MPRPKVPPSRRQRAPEACVACRISKKRCSGSFPCTNCLRKGLSDSCGGCPPPRTARSSTSLNKASQPSLPEAVPDTSSPALASACEQAVISRPSEPVVSPTITTQSTHRRPSSGLPGLPGSLSPEAPHRTHPRMLRNLQGERGRAPSIELYNKRMP